MYKSKTLRIQLRKIQDPAKLLNLH
jgi:hypothetical protein